MLSTNLLSYRSRLQPLYSGMSMVTTICKPKTTLYNNIIVKGSSPPHVSELVLQLGKAFAMKDLGPFHYFLELRMMVVRLQYLILTRLDIIHDFIQNPNIQHDQGVKRILRYIKGTIHFRLRIISQSPCRLYGYPDDDLRGCTTPRRSTTDYSINLGANCISWTSKKQNTVARSIFETEHRELASTAAEMTWILYILYDL
uniref:Reverse transcriptase Ty1/copia-type domain-containing protein n=1 Tax=Solanum lycopersicum TaxID=4081 RepID=A0A3Q7IHW6_SOLLC